MKILQRRMVPRDCLDNKAIERGYIEVEIEVEGHYPIPNYLIYPQSYTFSTSTSTAGSTSNVSPTLPYIYYYGTTWNY